MSFSETWTFDGDLETFATKAEQLARRARVELRVDRPAPSVSLVWATAAGRKLVASCYLTDDDESTFLSADYIHGDNQAEWGLARELVVDLAARVGAAMFTEPDDDDSHGAAIDEVLELEVVVDAARRLAGQRELKLETVLPVPDLTCAFIVPLDGLEKAAHRLDQGADVSDIDPPFDDDADHYELGISACAQDGDHPPEIQLESNEYDNRAAWSVACVFASALAESVGAKDKPEIDDELFQMLLAVPRVAKNN